MSKKKITKRKFTIVDLVRKKPTSKYIEVPKYRVDIQFEVITTGILWAEVVPSSAMDRLEKAARETLDRYETVITEEATRLATKVEALMSDPSPESQKAAADMVQTTNQMIKNALASSEAAAHQAIQARLKKEAQKNGNLNEARVRTVVKCTVGTLKLGTSVAKLVATSGADLSSYMTIASELGKFGMELNQQLKNEEKLRKDLQTGLQAYIKLRATTIQKAVEKNKIEGSDLDYTKPMQTMKKIIGRAQSFTGEMSAKNPKELAKSIVSFVDSAISKELNNVEFARKAYREHTTKTMNHVDRVCVQADKLAKAMKSAKTLKEGVKVGAACMKVKRNVSQLAKKLEVREKYLADMEDLMVGQGLKIDDTTTLQRIKALDTLAIMETFQDLRKSIKTVESFLEAVA